MVSKIKVTISGPQASGKTILANLFSDVLAEYNIYSTLEGEETQALTFSEAGRLVELLRKLGSKIEIVTTIKEIDHE